MAKLINRAKLVTQKLDKTRIRELALIRIKICLSIEEAYIVINVTILVFNLVNYKNRLILL
jgi:hypothetical protein